MKFTDFADSQMIRFSSFQRVDYFFLRKRGRRKMTPMTVNYRSSYLTEKCTRSTLHCARQRWCRSNFVRHCPAVNGVHAKRAVCPMQFRNEIIDFFKNCHLPPSLSFSLARFLARAAVHPSFVSSSVSTARCLCPARNSAASSYIYTAHACRVSHN